MSISKRRTLSVKIKFYHSQTAQFFNVSDILVKVFLDDNGLFFNFGLNFTMSLLESVTFNYILSENLQKIYMKTKKKYGKMNEK